MRVARNAASAVVSAVVAAMLVVAPDAVASAAAPAPADVFHAVPLARVLDTVTGVGTSAGRVAGGALVRFAVAGRSGVPASGAAVVALTVTVTGTSAHGHLTVFGGGGSDPAGTSNLSFARAQTIGNLVLAPLGADGTVSVANHSAGAVDVLADVQGWFSVGTTSPRGGYRPLPPRRVLDTTRGIGGATAPVRGNGTRRVVVGGAGSPPMPARSSSPSPPRGRMLTGI